MVNTGASSTTQHSCLVKAWHEHSAELKGWLHKQQHNDEACEDVLQQVFFKALANKSMFCGLENPRSWLFRVARNILIDAYRVQREYIEMPEDFPEEETLNFAIDELTDCLPRVLTELGAEDREVITLCDLDGMKQERYAALKGISLPAAKSRVQRARKRLRATLETNCQVQRDDAGNVCCFVPRGS
jgi:RNA polymerase sigma-70 factor (ECF subfamily)